MGGHGGLNILPQKRWNVYNFDNRERVRRDEENAAREEQARREKARRAELEFKLDSLREIAHAKRRRTEGGSQGTALEGEKAADGTIVRADGVERPQHINLFADLEAKALEEGEGKVLEKKAEEEARGQEKPRHERHAGKKGVEKVDGKATGEPVNENYSLGHGAVDKNGKKPWYMYKSFMLDKTSDQSPITAPNSHLSGVEARRTDRSGKRSLEELREERLTRETQEKDRVRRLLAAKAGSSANYDLIRNRRAPLYHGSYGNAR